MKSLKQSGFGLLSSLVTIVVSSLLYYLFIAMQTLSLNQERQRWEMIANSTNIILRSYEQYFDYDCFADGVVTERNLNYLITNGFLDEELVFNPHDFTYEITLERPSTHFDSTGRVTSNGLTKFILTTEIEDAYQMERMTQALKSLSIPFESNAPALTISYVHNMTENDLNQQFLNGGMGFNCF